MNTNLGGNYAFRNSIDLNATADNQVTFNSVGDSNNAFTGNLDGLGYEVYGLHIDEKITIQDYLVLLKEVLIKK